MNNLMFCHNCGTQIPVGSKFCTSCGTSQASLSANPPPPPQQQTRQQTRTAVSFRPRILGGNRDDDDEIVADKVESVDDLGLTFAKENFGLEEPNYPQQQFKEKIGDVIIRDGTLAPTPLRPRDVLGSTVFDPKIIREEFKQEAGAMRPESRTHNNKSS